MDTKKLLEHIDLFPKVELHRHIEGSFCLDTLFEIATKNKVEAPDSLEEFKKEAQFPQDHEPDFLLFLSKFRNDWYGSLEDIDRLIYNSVKNFKKENLFYIELRFSPEHFALKNDFDRVEVAKTLISAAKRAAKEIKIHIKFLITFNRNKQNQHEMLSLYRQLQKAGLDDIIGMDLAGDEIANPPEEFVELFDVIKSDGIGATVHAGEVTTPKQIWDAVQLLHAKRIGHGTKAEEDEKLQEMLIDKEIYLEQCPVSNYFTGSCVDTPHHPFLLLNKKGVLVTLNSDDPTIQNTTLSDDFVAAINYYGVGFQEAVDLNIRSLTGSFSPDRQNLIQEYQKAVQRFVDQVKA